MRARPAGFAPPRADDCRYLTTVDFYIDAMLKHDDFHRLAQR